MSHFQQNSLTDLNMATRFYQNYLGDTALL